MIGVILFSLNVQKKFGIWGWILIYYLTIPILRFLLSQRSAPSLPLLLSYLLLFFSAHLLARFNHRKPPAPYFRANLTSQSREQTKARSNSSVYLLASYSSILHPEGRPSFFQSIFFIHQSHVYIMIKPLLIS